MYVVVREETEGVLVHVMGEKLALGKDGAFLLPGRLIHALKPEDLPEGVSFSLEDTLPCGAGFYQEDHVVFRREEKSLAFQVDVTSSYDPETWDGLFPLGDTLRARYHVLKTIRDIDISAVCLDEKAFLLSYRLHWQALEEEDLDSMLLAVCVAIGTLENRGNERLWYGGRDENGGNDFCP
ncbi:MULTISPECIES: hypothetical protein [Brevibacillus]|jgi:hypothetical protein|uniref:Uncharacterized protein n=1 Tax=Brevibacillus borstelensis AK1 TaxID=1300222 RepID=M8DIQ8_9BACL|nr:hypothetical protein [Brevibacillus borstelensis]EMT53468.1 hypothetical protein I532_05630 [Brevibacillus borstelensis AK1]KKX53141.1 hypothetical protein X546_21590 [Brevibacillus borstelensis cifa_chp40]MED1745348.1 hypothetical protein [Brevibacillus borstelensis]MED1875737.1 hypothetical protein [Brevibacillus borstelensis]MED1884506.1 hypothetical protein [Brevibacillus borstelensis]